MSHSAAPIYSLPALARFAGLNERRLRFLLAEGSVKLLDCQPIKGRHARGSALDAIRFAVAEQMLARRFTPAEVAYALDATLDPVLSGLAGCFLEIPRALVLDRLHGLAIRLRFDVRGRLAEASWARPGAETEPSDAVFYVYPLRLAERAFALIGTGHTSTGARLPHTFYGPRAGIGGRPNQFIAGPPALAAEKGNPTP